MGGLPVAALLGCAGDATPTSRVSRSPLAIDLLDGTVSEDSDRGASGDYDVTLASSTQGLSWGPIDAAESLDERLDAMFVAAGDAVTRSMPPEHVDGTVSGQPARTFHVRVAGQHLLVTAWRCPDAGVSAQLATTGTALLAQALHERSLASVACGRALLVAEARAHAWRFVAPEGWSSDGGERAVEGESVIWTRADGRLIVETSTVEALGDAALPTLCTGILHVWHDRVAAYIRFDETRSTFVDEPGGCVLTWAGVDADSKPQAGRHEARKCGTRGYSASCVALPPARPDECRGLVACAD